MPHYINAAPGHQQTHRKQSIPASANFSLTSSPTPKNIAFPKNLRYIFVQG
jgi:hypothetical protein